MKIKKEEATPGKKVAPKMNTTTSNYRAILVSLLPKLQRAESNLHKQFVLDSNPATAGVWITCAQQLRITALALNRGSKEEAGNE